MNAFGKTIFTGGIIVLFAVFYPAWGQGDKKDKKTKAMTKKESVSDKKNPIDSFMDSLLAKYPQYFDSIIKKKDGLKVQAIYTQVTRDKKGKPIFTDHFFNVDTGNYYYPASTVKLPIALLTLQKLNELKIAGLDKNTTMITGQDGDEQTEVCNDPSTADGRPTIAHYIKKILLVSDNDAFNRLYEFLGQEYINNSLHKMGYNQAQIIHRLDITLTETQNRHTNPVEFYDTSGKLIYKKPAERSELVYADRNTKMGIGFYRGGKLVNEPFDFSKKNRLPLQYLHSIVRSVLFPEAVPERQRFNITDEDYAFLQKYMSMIPGESKYPFYGPPDYWDNYVKFLFYGSEKRTKEPDIRIFNKVGDAYGFLIDAAYIADYKNKVEFFLSAMIYCNSDGIFNDDKYDYDSVGFPFMKNLGRVVYDYELKQQKKRVPDLSAFQFQYKD